LAWSHFKHVETTFAGGVASFKVCYGELELQPVFVDLVSLLHTDIDNGKSNARMVSLSETRGYRVTKTTGR
jgi:hypothetical protein